MALVFSLLERERDLWSPRGFGEGERPLLEAVLVRGEDAERRRREDLDFSAGSGEDTEGLLRRLGGVLERVSGEDDAERLLRESRAFLVSSGDDRELRRRGGVRDLVLGSGDDRELLLAVLDLLERTRNCCFLQEKGLCLCLMNLICFVLEGLEGQEPWVQERNQNHSVPWVLLLASL